MTKATRRAVSRRTAGGIGVALAGALVTGCSSAVSRSAVSTATHTVRAGEFVVTGDVSTSRLQSVGREARTAVQRVRAVWGSTVLAGIVHIEVPADDAGFRALGGSAGRDAQIAATTTPEGRVVLAPRLFTRVSGEGRVVVLTHELTHVALHHAGDVRLARWVVEGAAEFTAYRATGLPLSRLTPQLFTAVRSGHLPTGPPSDARFADAPEAAYQQAYAWCDFLVERFGIRRFTGFVRSASDGGERDFRSSFGVTPGSLQSAFETFLRAAR